MDANLFDVLSDMAKRMLKSGYTQFVLLNGMWMACYDMSEDTDIGMHYIFHIPPEVMEKYDAFHERFIWAPGEFMNRAADMRAAMKDLRLKHKLPPRAVTEEAEIKKHDDVVEIKITMSLHNMVPNPNPKRKSLVLGDSIVSKTDTIKCSLYTEPDYLIGNILDTYQNVSDRVTDTTVTVDLLENDLIEQIKSYPRVYYIRIDIGKEKLNIPMMRSFLRGINKFSRLLLTVVTTNIPDVFAYVITIESGGYTDQYVSYILNFK